MIEVLDLSISSVCLINDSADFSSDFSTELYVSKQNLTHFIFIILILKMSTLFASNKLRQTEMVKKNI